MAGAATYGIAALAAGLFGWWWMGRPAAPPHAPPGGHGTPDGSGAKPPPKVYADRATAQADWQAGALDGAADGYDAGAAGMTAADYHPEANVTFPASAVSFKAYANGFLCGSRTGFRLGQRARSLFGSAATGTHFDPTNADSRQTVTAACADGFSAWFAAHGAEPIEPRPSGASVGAGARVARLRVPIHPSSRAAYAHRPLPPAPVSPTLGTAWVTRAAPHRVY